MTATEGTVHMRLRNEPYGHADNGVTMEISASYLEKSTVAHNFLVVHRVGYANFGRKLGSHFCQSKLPVRVLK